MFHRLDKLETKTSDLAKNRAVIEEVKEDWSSLSLPQAAVMGIAKNCQTDSGSFIMQEVIDRANKGMEGLPVKEVFMSLNRRGFIYEVKPGEFKRL